MDLQRTNKPIDVLLVEDNPGDVRLVKEAFEHNGIRVKLHVVGDGAAALDYLLKAGSYAQAPDPGLVLLDLNLPKKDGRQVLAEIKKHPELKSIPVVILTASEAEEDRQIGKLLHVEDYLTKPVNVEKFVAMVQRLKRFWHSDLVLPSLD